MTIGEFINFLIKKGQSQFISQYYTPEKNSLWNKMEINK